MLDNSATINAVNNSNQCRTAKKEDYCNSKIFVGGLSWSTTEKRLEEYFCKFGDVMDCVLMMDTCTRCSRGFGFVTYTSPDSVVEVLSREHYLDGKKIDPKAAFPKSQYSALQKISTVTNNQGTISTNQDSSLGSRFTKIFAGGIGPNTDQDLKNYFSSYGKVVGASIIMDKSTGRSRGFAFIDFDDPESAEKAVEVRYHIINEKSVEVKRAFPRDYNRVVELGVRDIDDLNLSSLTLSEKDVNGISDVSSIVSSHIWSNAMSASESYPFDTSSMLSSSHRISDLDSASTIFPSNSAKCSNYSSYFPSSGSNPSLMKQFPFQISESDYAGVGSVSKTDSSKFNDTLDDFAQRSVLYDFIDDIEQNENHLPANNRAHLDENFYEDYLFDALNPSSISRLVDSISSGQSGIQNNGTLDRMTLYHQHRQTQDILPADVVDIASTHNGEEYSNNDLASGNLTQNCRLAFNRSNNLISSMIHHESFDDVRASIDAVVPSSLFSLDNGVGSNSSGVRSSLQRIGSMAHYPRDDEFFTPNLSSDIHFDAPTAGSSNYDSCCCTPDQTNQDPGEFANDYFTTDNLQFPSSLHGGGAGSDEQISSFSNNRFTTVVSGSDLQYQNQEPENLENSETEDSMSSIPSVLKNDIINLLNEIWK